MAIEYARSVEEKAIKNSRLKNPFPEPKQLLAEWMQMLKNAVDISAQTELKEQLKKELSALTSGGMALQSGLEDARDRLAAVLPSECPNWLLSIPICILGTRDPNACALCGPNDHPIIGVDFGLVYNISRAARLFILSFNVTAPYLDKGKDLEGLIHDNNFQDLFRGLNFGRLEFLSGEVHDPPLSVRISGQDRLEAGFLTQAFLDFIIAHELSHVYLGHLEPARRMYMCKVSRDLEFYEKSREQEYEADKCGVHFFKAVAVRYPDIVAAAPRMLVKYLEFLESGMEVRQQEFRTHPLPQDRFNALSSMFKEITGTPKQYLKQFETIMNISEAIIEVNKKPTQS